MNLQQEKITRQKLVLKTSSLSNCGIWCSIYGFLHVTDNNQAYWSCTKVEEFDERRAKTNTSASSLLKYQLTEMQLIEMYLLHVTDDQVFSTESRVIFVTQLNVTDSHSSSNLERNSRTMHMLQITMSVGLFYSITKLTTVLLSRLTSHALT